MKYYLTVLLLIILFYNDSYSQTDVLEKRMTIHCENMRIEEIIKKISKQQNIRFSYGNLKDLKKVRSVHFINGKLKFILSKLFDGTRVRYMAYSDQLILVETEDLPQKKFLIGYVVEDETNSPIPYATIMLLKSGEGIIADYNGRFEIEFDKNKTDSIKINSLGYKSIKIPTLNTLDRNSVKIPLKKQVFPLEEIDIKADDYSDIILGNDGNSNLGALYLDTHGQEVALYIENHNQLIAKVEEVHFRLSSKGNRSAPFRIKIYKPDKSGRPGKDILNDLLVVRPDNDQSWYEVNISEFNVFIPKEGMFISMSGVFPNDYEFYFDDSRSKKEDKANKVNDLSYGQRLCYNKNGKNNTWHYSLSRQWFQLEKRKFNVMIRIKINYKKSQ